MEEKENIKTGSIMTDFKSHSTFVETKDGGARMIADFTLERLGYGWDVSSDIQSKDGGHDFILLNLCVRNGVQDKRVSIRSEAMADAKRFSDFFVRLDGGFMGVPRDLRAWSAALKEQAVEKGQVSFHLIKDKYGRWEVGGKEVWVFSNGFLVDGEFIESGESHQYEKNKLILVERTTAPKMAPTYTPGKPKELSPSIEKGLSSFFSATPSATPLILGFYASTLRHTEILDTLNLQGHTLLHISGKTSTGKTEMFTTMFSRLVGMERVKTNPWQGSSKFVIESNLSTISHFPIIIDEYRTVVTDSDGKKKDELLRNAYDRRPFQKGRQDLSMRFIQPVSTLIIMGEDMPKDAASRNRCVSIYVKSEDVVPKEEWRKVKAKAADGDWFTFFNYVVGKEIDRGGLMKDYKFFTSRVKSATRSDECYCHLLATYTYFFVPQGEDRELRMEGLAADTNLHMENYQEDTGADKNINDFFHIAEKVVGRYRGKYLSDYIQVVKKEVETTWYIYITGVFGLMGREEKNDLGISEGGVRDLLKKSYNAKPVQRKLDGVNRRVWEVTQQDAPTCLNENLAETLKDEEFKKDKESNTYE